MFELINLFFNFVFYYEVIFKVILNSIILTFKFIIK